MKKSGSLSFFCFHVLFALITLILVSSCSLNPFVGIGNDKDVQFPDITITSHQNTDYVGSDFTLTGICSDDKSVKAVKISAPGMSDIKVNTSGEWKANISTTGIANGLIKFNVTAIDDSGKQRKKFISLNVDRSGPVINLSYPQIVDASTDLTLQGKVNFTGTASDDAGANPISIENKLQIYQR